MTHPGGGGGCGRGEGHLAEGVNIARLGPNNIHGLGAFVEHQQLQYTSLSGRGDAHPDAFILETFVAAVWGNHGVLIVKVIRRAAAAETDTDDYVPQPAYMRRTKLREHHTSPYHAVNAARDSTTRRRPEPQCRGIFLNRSGRDP